MNSVLGSVIKSARIDRGYTQRQLGARARMHFTAVSRIETGRLKLAPCEHTLSLLADVLDLDEMRLNLLAGRVPSWRQLGVAQWILEQSDRAGLDPEEFLDQLLTGKIVVIQGGSDGSRKVSGLQADC